MKALFSCGCRAIGRVAPRAPWVAKTDGQSCPAKGERCLNFGALGHGDDGARGATRPTSCRHLVSRSVSLLQPEKTVVTRDRLENSFAARNHFAGPPKGGTPNVVQCFAFILLLALLCGSSLRAADWQVTFDPNGNLLSQDTATSALPQIISPPQPQVVSPGGLASFFVVLADTSGVSYEWQFNSNPISGATNDALLLTNVSAGNQGAYSVVVSNSSGAVTSASAVLMIDSDGDGLGDSWEMLYFTNLNQTAFGDWDGDSVSNLDEFLDATNPTNNVSALFRLYVSDGGGAVEISPFKSTYTNGEVVTLTGTASAPGIFRGWSGDIDSTNNPVVVVMNSNKVIYAHMGASYNFLWTGSSGDWHNRYNWTPNFVPGSNDNVSLGDLSITVTNNGVAHCHNLVFGGGSGTPNIVGSGELTLHGDSQWIRGTMNGGRTIVAEGATLMIGSGANQNTLSSRTLENRGTLLWVGTGGIWLSGSVITNAPTGVIDVQDTTSLIYINNSPGSRFDNAGTFRKSAGGNTTINSGVTFNNYGTVEVDASTLTIVGGGTSTGIFDIASGAALSLTGNTFSFNAATELPGPGAFHVNGGTVNFNGSFIATNSPVVIALGTANFASNTTLGNVHLSSGNLIGSGQITVKNQMTWTAGGLSGTGKIIVSPGASMTIGSGTTQMGLTSRTVENHGTITWVGTGGIWMNGAVITNAPAGVIEAQSAAPFVYYNNTPASRVDNAGLFHKTAGGTTTVLSGVSFNNYGTVQVDNGALQISGGGSNVGTFDLAAGTTLQFHGNTFNWNSAAELAGPGALVMTAGTINFNGSFVSTNNTITLSSATASFNGSTTLGNFNMSSGSNLTGPGQLVFRNQMTWTGGSISGTGRIILPQGASMSIGSGTTQMNLTSRTLENHGTISWVGTGGIWMNGAVITNAPDGVIEAQGAAPFVVQSNPSRFENAGLFRKTAGGTTSSGVTFNNYSNIQIDSGTLTISGGGLNSGSFDLAAGTLLHMFGNTFNWNGNSYVNGTGALSLAAGTMNFNGMFFSTNNSVSIGTATANFVGTGTVANVTFTSSGSITGAGRLNVKSNMTWNVGSMSGTGRTVIEPGATLMMSNPANMNLSRVLENCGTTLFAGAGGLYLSNALITNRPGALIEIRNAAGFIFPSGGGVSRFDNAGLLRKTISSGYTTLENNISLNNYGEVDIQTGFLWLGGGGVNVSNIHVSAGATFESRGTYTANAGSRIDGAGQFVVSAGTATFNGTVDVTGPHIFNGGTAHLNGNYNAVSNIINITTGTANFNSAGTLTPSIVNLNSGTLAGSSNVTVLSQMTWTGGAMTGSGRTIIAPGAILNMNNPANVTLARVLENGGTTLWTAAGGAFMANAVITNRPGALFHAQNAATLTYQTGVNRFDNAGTFRKSGNSGTTTIPGGVPFNNYGAVEIDTGILATSGGYTCTSNSLLHCSLAGTNVATGYGRLQSSGTVTLAGALRVAFTNGFFPAINDTFTVFTAGTRNGSFADFIYPSNMVSMQMSNTTTTVSVRVADITLTSGPPVITLDLPAAQVFYAGRVMTQAVHVAGGQPFGYQWMKNGIAIFDDARISGAQSGFLAITNGRLADSGDYQLIVTNAEGSTQSRLSAVKVQAMPKLNANGAGWSLQGTTTPVMNSNNVALTSGLGSTGRSVFYKAPLWIGSFIAQFTYVDVGGGGADGITFCMHNDPRGAGTLGVGGGGLGYGGISPSAALALNIYQPNTRGISFRINGSIPSPGANAYSATSPVNVASGNPIHITLLYTNGVMRTTLVESNTANTFTTNYVASIPALVGGETAYVGFTGGDGGIASTQIVSNFTFVPLTGVAIEQTLSNALTFSWPETIGGYNIQSISNLTVGVDTWQTDTNEITQAAGSNQSTIAPQEGGKFFRLSIDPND